MERRYLIAVPISRAQSKNFIALRDKYAPRAPRWNITLGPHITIVGPADAATTITEAKEKFLALKLRLSSQSVGFRGFDAFIGKSSSAVYVCPSETGLFRDLRKVYKSMFKRIANYSHDTWIYNPHLTLVNRLNQDGARELIADLQDESHDEYYTIDSVCLYAKAPAQANWRKIATKPLVPLK